MWILRNKMKNEIFEWKNDLGGRFKIVRYVSGLAFPTSSEIKGSSEIAVEEHVLVIFLTNHLDKTLFNGPARL